MKIIFNLIIFYLLFNCDNEKVRNNILTEGRNCIILVGIVSENNKLTQRQQTILNSSCLISTNNKLEKTTQ
jgi:hypothetical protein